MYPLRNNIGCEDFGERVLFPKTSGGDFISSLYRSIVPEIDLLLRD